MSPALTTGANDTMFTYIYLDPCDRPREVMLLWKDADWQQRAYWGEDLITSFSDGSTTRTYMGPIPSGSGWVRLEVPVSFVGLGNKSVTGAAFNLYGGKAWWDRVGKVDGSNRTNGSRGPGL